MATFSNTESATPSQVEQANSFQPAQVAVDGGILLTGLAVDQFKWSPTSESGNSSFIPDNLKDINSTTSLSIETPSGTPLSSIPNPTQIGDQVQQAGQNLPLQTGSNLLASQTGLISNSNPVPEVISQPEISSELKTPENSNQVRGNLPRINSFFEPKLIPQNISIDLKDLVKVDQEKIRQDLGFAPFIWYSDLQIEYRDIQSFSLKYENSLPTINLTFNDSFGIMKKKGFPADDTLITVFFNSRSKNLRSIKLDFKVYTFKDFQNGSYSITGIIDIPLLYTRKFESFQNRSSHEVLREVAKNLGCGFCSNLNDTNDRMTWINSGESSLNFISNIFKNAYVSDDTFLFCYVDFYYNLCYVDINKELTRDINEDVMVNSMGFDKVKAEGDQGEERLIPLQLSNDPSFEASNGFIREYIISNNSTKLSIFNSYRTKSQYWNVSEKELSIFNIETITPKEDNVIILKGRADDSTFFRENIDSVWLGKRDGDNSHTNFNYAELQNRLNLDEITKIGATLTLSTPNLNLYLFQKVKVIFSVKKLTPTNEEQFMPRLTGDWMIVGMEIKFNNGVVSQTLKVIKTGLSLTPEEAEKAVAPKEKRENEVAERNTNQPTDPIPQQTPEPDRPIPTPPPVDWEILYPSYQGTEKGNNIKIIIDTLRSKGMTNPYSIVGILTIIGKETGFIPKNEDLNYSKERLPEVWGKFSRTGKRVEEKGQGKNYYNELATQYEKNSEKLANFVYGNKYGNGSEESGDGFKYRGRGFNQITFKGTYDKIGKKLGKDFVSNPDSLNEIRSATESLYVFFRDRCLERGAKISGGIDGSNSVDEAILKFAWANAGWSKPKDHVLNFAYASAKKYESKFEISNKGITT